MQLTAAVSFLTVLQEESVSIHTYSHSFLHIILQNLEHRDSGQGCTTILMTDYFYMFCFLSDRTILCKAVSAITVTLYLDLDEWKDFACWPPTYWYLNVILIQANKNTLSEGLNPKVVTESKLLLKYQNFVAEQMEGGWLTFLLWLVLLNFFDTIFRIQRKKNGLL